VIPDALKGRSGGTTASKRNQGGERFRETRNLVIGNKNRDI